VTQLGLTFDIVLDADIPSAQAEGLQRSYQSVASLYRLRGQPSTYVISPEGVVMSIFYGATTRQTLEAALEPFLRDS
jgi:hypothetical protein